MRNFFKGLPPPKVNNLDLFPLGSYVWIECLLMKNDDGTTQT